MVGKKVELRAVEVVALRAVWKVELMGWLMVGSTLVYLLNLNVSMPL